MSYGDLKRRAKPAIVLRALEPSGMCNRGVEAVRVHGSKRGSGRLSVASRNGQDNGLACRGALGMCRLGRIGLLRDQGEQGAGGARIWGCGGSAQTTLMGAPQ